MIDDRVKDAALLALLAMGLTDSAIAKKLDVSTRTVQRRVRMTMDDLGARSRFEAGYMAARRGWI